MRLSILGIFFALFLLSACELTIDNFDELFINDSNSSLNFTYSSQKIESLINNISGNSSLNGTIGYIPYFNTSSLLDDSNIFYDGTDLGISTEDIQGKLTINSTTASKVGLVVKGVTSQSANLAEWRLADDSLRARITEEGYFSNNRESFAGRVSEGFGEGTSVEGSWNTGFGGDITLGSGLFRATALGYGASVSANDGTAIGYEASASGNSVVIGSSATDGGIATSVVIGSGSSISTGGYLSIGQNANASGTLASLALGRDTTASGFGSIAIGDDATASHTGTIVISNGFSNVASTANNQLIIGGTTWPINSIYFGKGVAHATPTDITLHGTGGSGTNIAGGDLTLSAGKATGNAAGGDIIFQTSNAGGSGTTTQSSTTKMLIDNSGNVGVGTISPTHKLHVNGDQNLTGTLYYGALVAQSPHALMDDDSGHTRVCLVATNGDIVMQELVFNGLSYSYRFTKNHEDCLNKEVVSNVEIVTEEIEQIENVGGVIVRTNKKKEKEVITEFEKIFTGEKRTERKTIDSK